MLSLISSQQCSQAGQGKPSPQGAGWPQWRGYVQQFHVCIPGSCWKGQRRATAQEPPKVPRLCFSDEFVQHYDSIVKVAILVVAPSEAPEADEEEEESSDYTCALCEEFKDNPSP
ncbi:hypothetical protein CapIbe_024138 [Capra ibex]